MKTENYSRLYQNNYQIWIDNQKTQKMAWNSDSTQTISLFDHIKTKTYENYTSKCFLVCISKTIKSFDQQKSRNVYR